MGLVMEIGRIVLPVLIVGVIAVFVVLRMNHKYRKGTLGKKKSQSAQHLLDSLMPIGMIIGAVGAVLGSMFFQVSLLSAIAWGPGIGLLFGYVAYEIYSKTGEDYS